MTLDNKLKRKINKPLLISSSIVLFGVFLNVAITITTSVSAYNVTSSIVSAFAG